MLQWDRLAGANLWRSISWACALGGAQHGSTYGMTVRLFGSGHCEVVTGVDVVTKVQVVSVGEGSRCSWQRRNGVRQSQRLSSAVSDR